ncbi:hypothetical protein B0H11DRAFT_2098587, partial [Mycena galericulata]
MKHMPQVISNPSECVPSRQLLHIKILCLLGSSCILLPTTFPLHSPSWRDRCGTLRIPCASSRDGAWARGKVHYTHVLTSNFSLICLFLHIVASTGRFPASASCALLHLSRLGCYLWRA